MSTQIDFDGKDAAKFIRLLRSKLNLFIANIFIFLVFTRLLPGYGQTQTLLNFNREVMIYYATMIFLLNLNISFLLKAYVKSL